MVSSSADTNTCLFQESEEILVDDIKSVFCFTLPNDARDAELAGT
jgi:hypothetical protein